MSSVFGRGFAEVQIRKKWNCPYLLIRVEYFDKTLDSHWNWQTLAQDIAKCHFSLFEALPMSNLKKKKKIKKKKWNVPLLLNRV